jgi:hypothetical protein
LFCQNWSNSKYSETKCVYFEEKSKVALHKYEKAVEHNNEIILQNPESESSTKLTIFVDMSWMLKFLISLVLVLHLKFYTYFWD